MPLLLLSVLFLFGSCDDGEPELFCLFVTDCLQGVSTAGLYAHCYCTCDEGWCGERCEINIEDCGVNLNGSGEDCECKCASPFTNPPACDQIILPLANPLNYLTKSDQHEDYFPLVSGNRWIFDGLDENGNKIGELGFVIHKSFEFNDLRMYDMRLMFPDTITNMIDPEGPLTLGPLLYNEPGNENRIKQYKNDTTRIELFLHHYEVPDTVIMNDTEMYVSDAGSVTVPAGTFEDCIKIVDEYGSGNIMAPGVGWIVFLDEDEVRTLVLSGNQIECSVGAEISVTNLSCFGSDDGQIAIQALGNQTDLEYNWEGPVTLDEENVATELSAGIYSVTISSSDCMAVVDSIPVTSPDEIVLEFESQPAGPNDTGSATVTVSGGQPGYSYQWQDGQSTAEITGLPAGTYMVTVTDSAGCSTVGSVEIESSTSTEELDFGKLNVYPNPTQDNLFIELESANNRELEFQIVDIDGRATHITGNLISHSTFEIRTDNLRTGLYYLKLKASVSKGIWFVKI